MKTLLTAREVIQNSPVKSTFPDVYICDQLQLRERDFFRKCMSLDIYDNLIADLKTYPDNPYQLSSTYNKDDVVIYEGGYYISLVDNNDKTPGTVLFWKKADKFEDECYNDIWCRGLKTLLAYRVILPAIRYATYQAGAKGVVIHMEHGDTHEKTADHRSFEQYLRQIESDSEIMLSDVMDIIKNSECADKFSIFDECKETNCRIGLNRMLLR